MTEKNEELKPPDKIYLQYFNDDGELEVEPTWCVDKINDNDIEYIRPTPQTGVTVEELKELLFDYFGFHEKDGTYTHELIRVKEGYKYGTISIEDFEEWTEENIDDLAKAIHSRFCVQGEGTPKVKESERIAELEKQVKDLLLACDLGTQKVNGVNELIKELELLKSYFEDARVVELHKNDIKWDVINGFIDDMKSLNRR